MKRSNIHYIIIMTLYIIFYTCIIYPFSYSSYASHSIILNYFIIYHSYSMTIFKKSILAYINSMSRLTEAIYLILHFLTNATYIRETMIYKKKNLHNLFYK